ncbi:MAG: hypothetical protein RBR38_13255 [Desulfomicrobium apsheronum]|nr:hypothetical protein [Desulfomicrobium apsheronum]
MPPNNGLINRTVRCCRPCESLDLSDHRHTIDRHTRDTTKSSSETSWATHRNVVPVMRCGINRRSRTNNGEIIRAIDGVYFVGEVHCLA